MAFALTGARVFDGEIFHDHAAVVVDGRTIAALLNHSAVPSGVERIDLQGGLLAPGFIDVQVNGGGGALLNHDPSQAVVQTIASAHRRFGTTGLLPTVITDKPEVTAAAVAAVRTARANGAASVLGIHVEGPFLDPKRKGAHDQDLIRKLTDEDVALLSSANCGAVMLTVAPNVVAPEDIRRLAQAGILVSLGHAEANYAEACAAIEAGACAFTHLFNAMSQMTGREPGMVGAALADKNSCIGIIADGHHVHATSLKLAVACAGAGRIMLITDAMPTAADGPPTFELQGRCVSRVNGRLQLADGTLAGSDLTMDKALRYAVNVLDIALGTALQMASRNPARFLRRPDLGVIAPDAIASLVHFDDNLCVQQTWVEGA